MLRGLGQVIFLDSPLAGLCLLLGLRLADGRMALWALLGSSGGFALALFSGWPGEGALAGLYGYNATLTAIALAQVHRNLWVPALGILLALLLQRFQRSRPAGLTMPFILACWLIRAGAQSWQQAVRNSTSP